MNSRRLPKIIILGPAQGAGGMATCIRLQMESSIRKQAELFLFDNSKRTRHDRPLWRGIASQLGLLIRFVTFLITKRPDIVHIHTCSGPTFYRNSLDFVLAKLVSAKVIWHIHGAQFDAFLSGLKGASRWWCNSMLARADTVIVLGRSWEYVVRAFCPNARTTIIENGIVIPPLPTRESYAQSNVLFLGDLSKRKGVDDLIAASLAARTDHQLRIIGPDVENRLEGFRQSLATETNNDRVHFLGTLESAQVTAELADADVFVLPSYAEGLPMAMLEAMAAGLPIIVTDVGAIPEVITDGQNGFIVDPGDVESLRDKLETLIVDQDLRLEIGGRGRETVRNRFGYDRVAGQLTDLYFNLIPDLRQSSLGLMPN
jgi:glycosyltransferase involved in cell wall biosynthesis